MKWSWFGSSSFGNSIQPRLGFQVENTEAVSSQRQRIYSGSNVKTWCCVWKWHYGYCTNISRTKKQKISKDWYQIWLEVWFRFKYNTQSAHQSIVASVPHMLRCYGTLIGFNEERPATLLLPQSALQTHLYLWRELYYWALAWQS